MTTSPSCTLRMTLTAAAVGGMVLALAACGSRAEPGGSGTVPTATGSAPTTGAPQVVARDEIAVDKPAGVGPNKVWTADAQRTVGVTAQAGGCTTVAAKLGDQTDKTVTVIVVRTTAKSKICPQNIYLAQLKVKLDAPLGDRTVTLETEQVTK